VSCKICLSKNKWNKVKVYAYVSMFVYFSYFWTIIGSSKYAIVTANKDRIAWIQASYFLGKPICDII
jgi:hypothetical protein